MTGRPLAFGINGSKIVSLQCQRLQRTLEQIRTYTCDVVFFGFGKIIKKRYHYSDSLDTERETLSIQPHAPYFGMWRTVAISQKMCVRESVVAFRK